MGRVRGKRESKKERKRNDCYGNADAVECLGVIRSCGDRATVYASNQSMKPMAPDEMTVNVFASNPVLGLSLSR